MRAVRLVKVGSPLQTQDVDVPATGPSDVLVRVRGAGICHSDVHYRAGVSAVSPLPRTLGHEVAGVVERVGDQVGNLASGDRVCLHYVLSCGNCHYCVSGSEQFCVRYAMLGRNVDGGYAQYVIVPARNAVRLPDEISFEHGAVLMCSSATALHALRKSRLRGGETVAVFGAGGLGMSAIQIARALGALDVYAVDIKPGKLRLAEKYGAIGVDATAVDAVACIRELTAGRGVDVALELVGLPLTMQQAVRCLAPMGRAVIGGISDTPLQLDTYREVLGPEAEIIGTNDHLLSELPFLIELARRGKLELSEVVTRTVPLDADAINEVMDSLERFSADVRTVIVP
jgi:2-desacetyl-2-hydroxyethyl bacteriochlorophyllide A dehydrogenase